MISRCDRPSMTRMKSGTYRDGGRIEVTAYRRNERQGQQNECIVIFLIKLKIISRLSPNVPSPYVSGGHLALQTLSHMLLNACTSRWGNRTASY